MHVVQRIEFAGVVLVGNNGVNPNWDQRSSSTFL